MKVLIYIEDGCLCAVYASPAEQVGELPKIELFDEDDLETAGVDSEEREKRWNEAKKDMINVY